MICIDKLIELLATVPFKDIAVNSLASFLGGLALLWLAIGSRGVRSLRSKLERPKVRIEQRRTPENIFTGLELGSPARWVEQQLGVPSRVGEKWWGYRFSDSLVVLSFCSNDSLESISVALISDTTTFEFPACLFECPSLGKLTLKDLQIVDGLDLHYEYSLRHSELRMTGRDGPPGSWHYVAFGALSPQIPGPLLPSDFEWDRDKNTLISKPEDVKINWAAVSSTSDIQSFPWGLWVTI